MKVSDLIELLKTFPQNAVVVTEGYEEGLEPIKRARIVKVEEAQTKEWYYGQYDWSGSADAIEVVFLDAEAKNQDRFEVQ